MDVWMLAGSRSDKASYINERFPCQQNRVLTLIPAKPQLKMSIKGGFDGRADILLE
ncbi:MAG: hypothetical protein Q7T24_05560 [Deltaproteobacteria bacterium]|nr:hypothetical protein [Deltaproteobacteria bacterium]